MPTNVLVWNVLTPERLSDVNVKIWSLVMYYGKKGNGIMYPGL